MQPLRRPERKPQPIISRFAVTLSIRANSNALLDVSGNAELHAIGNYLAEMAEDCPHSFFQTDVCTPQSTGTYPF